MSVIDTKAAEVSAILQPSHQMEAGSDRPFLVFLKELLTTLLPLLLTCVPLAKRNAAGLQGSLNSPNFRQRLGLRWHLRRNMDDPRTGNLKMHEVEDALYKMGAACTNDDAKSMMAEVQNDG